METTDKLKCIKMEHFCCKEDTLFLKKNENRRQTLEENICKTQLVKDLYPKYSRNSEHSTIKKQRAQLKK